LMSFDHAAPSHMINLGGIGHSLHGGEV
jgi:hypothetical protein